MDSAPAREVVKKILPHWTEVQVDFFLGSLWDYGFQIASHAAEQESISGHQNPDHHKHKHHHHTPPQKKPGDI